jgi:hypothetical protein
MKNSLYIDFDSDRDDKVKITKPKDMVDSLVSSNEENKLLLNDLTTCMHALGMLIDIANNQNILNKKQSAEFCIEYLKENFINGN